jgi:hypothetical protein
MLLVFRFPRKEERKILSTTNIVENRKYEKPLNVNNGQFYLIFYCDVDIIRINFFNFLL